MVLFFGKDAGFERFYRCLELCSITSLGVKLSDGLSFGFNLRRW